MTGRLHHDKLSVACPSCAYVEPLIVILVNQQVRRVRCPAHVPEDTHLPLTDAYLDDLAVALLRFQDAAGHLWELAVKAGHNDEHHNHNDIGSYLLNIDGQRMLTEIGAPEYVKDFFGQGRYTFLATRSLGHPVPIINGYEQPAGAAFRGTILRHEFTPQAATLEIDLTSAYPAAAGCNRCLRKLEIDKHRGTLRITDTFDLQKLESLETAIITESPCEGGDNRVRIAAGCTTLVLTAMADTVIGEIQLHTFNRHADGVPQNVYRIVLTPPELKHQLTLGYEYQVTGTGTGSCDWSKSAKRD